MKRRGGPSAECKLRVMKRDKFMCAYCGVSGNDAELEIDHIHPASKGGSNHVSNLATACRACNQKKSDGALEISRSELSSSRGLVGLYVHTYVDDDQPRSYNTLEHQGQIVGESGDLILVQLFSWLDGVATIVKPFKRDWLLTQRLFAHEEVWAATADAESKQWAKDYEAGKWNVNI